jgi:hypothetical protein
METEKKPQVKKEWTKPELIVLVRSKPEEGVLTACKHNDGVSIGGGPYDAYGGCAGLNRCDFPCDAPSSS